MGWRKFVLICLFLMFSLTLIACGSRNSPEAAVQRFYEALEAQDMDKYLDTLDPDLRQRPNPMALLNAFNFGVSFGGFGIGFDLGALTRVSFREMSYRTLDVSEGRAHVQVEGKVRILALGMEVPFCDVHLARKVKGRWYVSYDEAEEQAKFERWQSWYEQNVIEAQRMP